MRATALRDVSGRIVKWFGMNIDITDHRRNNQDAQNGQPE
jgi:hypothetical protein